MSWSWLGGLHGGVISLRPTPGSLVITALEMGQEYQHF